MNIGGLYHYVISRMVFNDIGMGVYIGDSIDEIPAEEPFVVLESRNVNNKRSLVKVLTIRGIIGWIHVTIHKNIHKNPQITPIREYSEEPWKSHGPWDNLEDLVEV